jgi:hypothetical protein
MWMRRHGSQPEVPSSWAEASAQTLGGIERRVPLTAARSLAEAGPEAAELCLAETGIWIVAGPSSSEAPSGQLKALPLAAGDYALRALGPDLIHVAGTHFAVSRSHKRAGRALVALGRLRTAQAVAQPADFTGRYTRALSALQRAVLGAWLAPGERLLAALPARTVRDAARPQPGAAGALLVLSDRRLSVVTIDDLGSLAERALEVGALELEHRRGRRRVRRANVSLRPAVAIEQFEELSAACGLLGDERVLEVCRAGYRSSPPEQRPMLDALLEHLEQRGNPAARMARVLLRLEAGSAGAGAEALQALAADALGCLARLWSDFQLSESLAAGVIDALIHLRIARTEALDLARALCERQRAAAANEDARVEIDLRFARWARRLDASAPAVDLLAERGHALGAVPLGGARGVGPERRIELFELLFEIAPTASPARRRAALELTQLDPMSHESFERLAQAAGGPVAERARECLDVLGAGVLERAEPADASARHSPRALDAPALENRLQHPLLRGGTPLALLIRSTIAARDAPNTETLREYCERIAGAESAASRALEHATQALGMRGVEAYISRGVRAVGLRAYEAEPPFILLGGKHLDPASPHHLSYLELCFALGVEVLHLRLEHLRVSSGDVWLGALDKSRQGVELLLGVLPLLGGWRLAGQVAQRGAGQLDSPLLRRLWGATVPLHRPIADSLLGKLLRRPAREELTLANEDLLVAQRLMQLSADRAGLLLADSLRTAVRAILLTRADYTPLLRPDPESTLLANLEQRSRAGDPAFVDLSVRIGALTAFYVSEDYAALRSALWAS